MTYRNNLQGEENCVGRMRSSAPTDVFFHARFSPSYLLSNLVPDDHYSARKDLDDEDMLSVLERCYNVFNGRKNSNASACSTVTPSSLTHTSFLAKHFKRHTFDAVKHRLTRLDHNLYDLIWPSVKKLPNDTSLRAALELDFPIGIVAPDSCSYHVFEELLEPVVKDYNNLDASQELGAHPRTTFGSGDVAGESDLDPGGKLVVSGSLQLTRNLAGFELPKSLNHAQLEEVERAITEVLMGKDVAKALYPHTSDQDIEEKGNGVYYTMNEVLEEPSEARVLLASNNLLIPLWNLPDSDRLQGAHWPYGRGVFVSNGANLAVWVNVLDHLRVVTCTDPSRPGNVGQIFARIDRLVTVLSRHLGFRFDPKLGFLSARPTAIGNALQFGLVVRFPHLIKEPENLRHLCVVRNLTYHRSTSTSDVVRLGNRQSLGVGEHQCFEDFRIAVANILQLEKQMAMSNSLHMAALFLNVFRKKKLAQSA